MVKKAANTSAFANLGGLDFLGTDSTAAIGQGARAEQKILVELIRPDPVQPRRVLPYDIHQDYHSEKINSIQAMRRYIEMVRDISKGRGRGWKDLQELVDYDENLTPEEATLRDLVVLATTLRGDNQVLPATVVDASQGAVIQYRIETGERRFWAQVLDMHFIPGYDGDGTMPCIVIDESKFSFLRQARENTSRSGLNAIATARQAALLLLSVNGSEIPVGLVEHGFYRQALDLDMRGFTNEILTSMGGISRNVFSYYKNLLALPDEALELADRYNVEESKLRQVLALPPDRQTDMVREIVEKSLTVQQVKAIVEGRQIEPPQKKSDPLPRPAVQLARLLTRVNKVQGEYIAKAILEQSRTPEKAREQIERLRELLDEAEGLLGE